MLKSLFYLLLINCPILFAQDLERLSIDELINKEIKINAALIKASSIVNTTEFENNDDLIKWENAIESLFELYLKDTLKEIEGQKDYHPSLVKQIMSYFNFKNIAQYSIDQYKWLSKLTKLHGPSILVAKIVSTIGSYGLPAVLVHLGLFKLAAGAYIFPYTLTVLAGNYFYTNYRIGQEIFKVLGNEDKVKEYWFIKNKIKKDFNLSIFGETFYTFEQNHNWIETIRIPKQSYFINLWRNFGYSSEELTFENIKKFIVEHEYSNQNIESILDNKSLSNDHRVLMIIHILSSEHDQRIVWEFKKHFSANIYQVKISPNWVNSEAWAKSLLSLMSSPADFYEVLKQMPVDITKGQLAVLWESLLLPAIAEEPAFNYTFVRRLVTDYHVIDAELLIDAKNEIEINVWEKFINYFNHSYSPENFKTQCFKSHVHVLFELLE